MFLGFCPAPSPPSHVHLVPPVNLKQWFSKCFLRIHQNRRIQNLRQYIETEESGQMNFLLLVHRDGSRFMRGREEMGVGS